MRLRRVGIKNRLISIVIVCFLVTAGFLGFITFKSDIVSATIIYVGSGPGNQTTSILDAIDNYANDGDTVYVYSGTYFENVVVAKRINLIGEIRDTTIIDGMGGARTILVEADWVNVSGFTVINGNNEGIYLFRVQNCRIFNNNVTSNILNGIKLMTSDNNNITGNTVCWNTGKGITTSGSQGNNITGNIASNNDIGIVIGGPGWNNITSNTIVSNVDKGISLYNADKHNIISNNISLNNDIGIFMDDSIEITIANNDMIDNGIHIRGEELKYWNTHNIDTSNTVNGKPVHYWKNQTGGKVPAGAGQVILANCSNVSVEGQELTNASVGIELGFSSNNYITGNKAISNSLYGIYLFGSSGNNILGNNASYNGFFGIDIQWSDGNNVIGNTASFNRGTGMSLQVNNHTIRGNTASNNEYGIYERSSNNNTVMDNTVSNNSYGIYVYLDSSNNKIYHNNIINNSNQAFDVTNNGNQWDNGYPSGGNYWSDFDEPGEGAYDDYQGVDQNVLGSDGKVDNGTIGGGGKNPYVIDLDSQDNYPLISPVDNFIFLFQGWNLISIPRIQSDTSIDTVLSSISGSYDAVQWYNISDASDPWKHYHTNKPPHLNDLESIDHTTGFWIHITEPGGILFEYTGTQPTNNQTIELHPGWNMVGYPSLSNRNRTKALNNLNFTTEVNSIWTYNAATLRWEEMGPDDFFIPGRGYWFHSKFDITWIVPL